MQDSITSVRDLSLDLYPPGMDQLGLVRTVYQYSEDFSERNNVDVDFYTAGMKDQELDFDTEINLYRLIQEGLNNIKSMPSKGTEIFIEVPCREKTDG